jgi:hypothetical protein
MKIVLESAIRDGILIGLRTDDQESDESIIGFGTELKESMLTLNEVDEYGSLIGKTVIHINSIISIDLRDRYQERLQFIHDQKSNFDPNKRVTQWGSGSELITSLGFLTEEKIISTFFFENDEYSVGYLESYNSETFLINNIGLEGDDDGTSCYLIDRLVGIRYNGLEEQKIKLLHDHRRKFYE